MRTIDGIDDLPRPLRFAVKGALALGVLGAVVGLIIGLFVHVATAWFAALEIGIPAAMLGAVLGLATGSVWAGVRHLREPASH